jgi:hypothetical protein
MPRLTTIRIPTRDGINTLTGTVHLMPLVEGGTPVRLIVEQREDGSIGNLTHYASGWQFYPRLEDLRVIHRLDHGSYAPRMTVREAVRTAIDRVVAANGLAVVEQRLAAVPILNPEPRRQRRGRGLLDAPSYD